MRSIHRRIAVIARQFRALCFLVGLVANSLGRTDETWPTAENMKRAKGPRPYTQHPEPTFDPEVSPRTGGRKLDPVSVVDVYRRAWRGEDPRTIASEYGVTDRHVRAIQHGHRWWSVTGHVPPTRAGESRHE